MREQEDQRHANFRKLLNGYKGQIYEMDTCENAEKLHYKVEGWDGTLLEQEKDKLLIPDLQSLLSKNKFQGANICIDITALKQGILFLLTRLLLNNIKPARLFAAYTEPTEYKKKKLFTLGQTEEYDLYDKIIGTSSGVPGFIKHRGLNDILLIAPLGFDSQRLQTIYEDLKPKKIIPVVGFPSFIPGWNLTAIKMNFMILKSAECFDLVKTCEAASPFAMFDLLNEEFHRHNAEFDIYISPLGTRPHCLGAAIFVAKNPSVYLIYDFPVEKLHRSESVLKTDIYHLSKYIG
jgi:hypothetical protein